MVRLFEEACRQLLSIVPQQRHAWLAAHAAAAPHAVALLTPIVDHFDAGVMTGKEVEEALIWCRAYITR
jgi:hypothetical protein